VVKLTQGAILAAGRGQRLRASGATFPKALAPVCGEPLLVRQARLMDRVGIKEVYAIVNSEIFERIKRDRISLLPTVKLVVRDTANSMETMLAFADYIVASHFVAITVDAVLSARDFSKFCTSAAEKLFKAEYSSQMGTPATNDRTFGGIVGVTRWQGDPTPLFTTVSPDAEITSFTQGHQNLVTAGIFAFSTNIFALGSVARSKGLNALRQLLALMVEQSVRLGTVELDEVVDVDEMADLERAEQMLREAGEQNSV